MRKLTKDYRKEIAHLNNRLQQYRIAYINEAQQWLAEVTSDPNTVTSRDGWVGIHEDLEIEERLRERFQDIRPLARPFNKDPEALVSVWRLFYARVIQPINEQAELQVKEWFRSTWVSHHVNGKAIIPAPQPIPMALKKINQREYQLGQIIIKITSQKEFREVHFMDTTSLRMLYKVQCHNWKIEDCIPMALPIAKRLARICNWEKYLEMSKPAQNAVLERLRIVTAYHNYGRWEYNQKRKQLKAWGDEGQARHHESKIGELFQREAVIRADIEGNCFNTR